jgi:hypothetical protein
MEERRNMDKENEEQKSPTLMINEPTIPGDWNHHHRLRVGTPGGFCSTD